MAYQSFFEQPPLFRRRQLEWRAHCLRYACEIVIADLATDEIIAESITRSGSRSTYVTHVTYTLQAAKKWLEEQRPEGANVEVLSSWGPYTSTIGQARHAPRTRTRLASFRTRRDHSSHLPAAPSRAGWRASANSGL